MRRALLLFGLIALGLVVTGPGASAHAFLQSSQPEEGAELKTAPAEIRLIYTEPVDAGIAQIRVFDQSGRDIGAGEPQPGSRDTELRVPLPDLGRGVYTVSWRVLSKLDGHVTAGSFGFGIEVDPGTVAAPPGGGPGELE